MKKEIFRLIDANFNRSREGLRVCEDIARFIFNSPALTKELKSARHDISNTIKGFSADLNILLESRDIEKDVGKRSAFKSEMNRTDSIDIFYANLERAKESLRVMEEFFKLIDKKISVKFKASRYRVYDIEKKSIKRISSLRDRR